MSRTALYLLAVYIESQQGDTPVSSGAIADRLDKSPPSVTEMLQRLDEQGLVVYESYVTLSWFFRSVLELETHESEAMELAGVINPSVVDRLTTVLPVEEQHPNDGD